MNKILMEKTLKVLDEKLARKKIESVKIADTAFVYSHFQKLIEKKIPKALEAFDFLIEAEEQVGETNA